MKYTTRWALNFTLCLSLFGCGQSDKQDAGAPDAAASPPPLDETVPHAEPQAEPDDQEGPDDAGTPGTRETLPSPLAPAERAAMVQAQDIRQAFLENLDEYIVLRILHTGRSVGGQTIVTQARELRLTRVSPYEYTGQGSLLSDTTPDARIAVSTDEVTASFIADAEGPRLHIVMELFGSTSCEYEMELLTTMSYPWQTGWRNLNYTVNGGPPPWELAMIELIESGTAADGEADRNAIHEALAGLAESGPFFGTAISGDAPDRLRWAQLELTNAGDGRYEGVIEIAGEPEPLRLTGTIAGPQGAQHLNLRSGRQRVKGRELYLNLNIAGINPVIVLESGTRHVAFTAVNEAYLQQLGEQVESMLSEGIGIADVGFERHRHQWPGYEIRLDPDTGNITGQRNYIPFAGQEPTEISGTLGTDETGFPVISIAFTDLAYAAPREASITFRVLKRGEDILFIGTRTFEGFSPQWISLPLQPD